MENISATEQIVQLIIPFIALGFLSVMIDKLVLVLENTSEKTPYFPNEFPWWLKYCIILCIAYYVSWQGNYDFWKYLNVNFNEYWQGHLMTAVLLSGGSKLIKVGFSMVDAIPSSVGGITTTVRRMTPRKDQRAVKEEAKSEEYDPNRFSEDI